MVDISDMFEADMLEGDDIVDTELEVELKRRRAMLLKEVESKKDVIEQLRKEIVVYRRLAKRIGTLVDSMRKVRRAKRSVERFVEELEGE